ncbi:lectin C-type domain protein [Ancylostoma caninum]|uniref:Lectin C-type domain protein n=1 Tax=Ancylostoma caninum TaxID=29170 RepID=A0A368FYP5_ANCCA|nr:lectin C-type domain protein [Ancylostoma caninum]
MVEDTANASSSQKLMQIGTRLDFVAISAKNVTKPSQTRLTELVGYRSYPKSLSNACNRIRQNSRLAHVSNEEEHEALKDLAVTTYEELENPNPIHYHIGLSYNDELGTYTWEGGVEDITFSKWDTNYPDLSKGKCVRAEVKSNAEVVWRNVPCSKAPSKAMCQTIACDTDNYCS